MIKLSHVRKFEDSIGVHETEHQLIVQGWLLPLLVLSGQECMGPFSLIVLARWILTIIAIYIWPTTPSTDIWYIVLYLLKVLQWVGRNQYVLHIGTKLWEDWGASGNGISTWKATLPPSSYITVPQPWEPWEPRQNALRETGGLPCATGARQRPKNARQRLCGDVFSKDTCGDVSVLDIRHCHLLGIFSIVLHNLYMT
jgi:hypothetical protein